MAKGLRPSVKRLIRQGFSSAQLRSARSMIISAMEQGIVPENIGSGVKVRLWSDDGSVRYSGSFDSMGMGKYSQLELIKKRSGFNADGTVFTGVVKNTKRNREILGR